jgi:hypothetical protein
MNLAQLRVILRAHPDIEHINPHLDGFTTFEMSYEVGHSDGGSVREIVIGAYLLVGGGFRFCTLYDQRGHIDIGPTASPETVCTALKRLIKRTHVHRDPDGDSILVGDEMLCVEPRISKVFTNAPKKRAYSHATKIAKTVERNLNSIEEKMDEIRLLVVGHITPKEFREGESEYVYVE